MLLALCCGAGAVELGEVQVRSHIGQALSADIELSGLASDNATVQAAIADADVYRGASIALHPALAAANLTTFRRDGRRYLHISSSLPVKADHLAVFFTLTENGQRSVRQATLWLSPDPDPAPAPAPAPAPVPAPVAVAAPVAAPVAAVVAAPPPAPKSVAPRPPVALPLLPAPPAMHKAISLPHASAAPACAARASGEAEACAVLDAKNAALNVHLAELEEKVKQLSAALQGAAGGVTAPAPTAPVKPKPLMKALPPKLVPMGSAPAPVAAGRPWLVIGISAALILALAAGLGVVLLRQRKKVNLKRKVSELVAADADTPAPRPSFIASVKNRLMPGRGRGGGAENGAGHVM